MIKENKLIKKIKHLLKRLKCPRWLHHFGPKTYEFYEHFYALLIKRFCKLSFRRTAQLFDLLGLRCPSKSALQYTAKKLNSPFWDKVLKTTTGSSHLIAIDSTGLTATNPSYHYLRRIDGKMPKIPIKLSIAFDTRKKKFSAAKIRVLPAHDIRDIKSLLLKSKPKVVVADKAYDANWVHQFCAEHNIKPVIPIRKNGKPKHKNWSLRMKAAQKFNPRVYHRRELSESANSSYKKKFGASISSKTVRTIRTEVYSALTCHNLFGIKFRDLGQSLKIDKVYKLFEFFLGKIRWQI